MIIYFDGGCRPNPGTMAMAFVTSEGHEFFELIGEGTNNMAEWRSLFAAASFAKTFDVKSVTFRGDSTLVVNQAKGLWKIKIPMFSVLRRSVLAQLADIDATFEFIPRAQNLAGHLIERKYEEMA